MAEIIRGQDTARAGGERDGGYHLLRSLPILQLPKRAP